MFELRENQRIWLVCVLVTWKSRNHIIFRQKSFDGRALEHIHVGGGFTTDVDVNDYSLVLGF